MFNNEITSTASNGSGGEDLNCPPALEGLRNDDDLFIQSDDDVTPMTDIEDSSGDEVCDEDSLRMHMKPAHDEVMNSDGLNPLSISRTTIQIKHVMPEVKMIHSNDNVKETMSPVTASESAEPGLKPLGKDPFNIHVCPSGTDPRIPPQGEAATKNMLPKQSSPADTKQKGRGAPGKGNSQQLASPNHGKEEKGRVKKGINLKENPVCYKRYSSSGQKKNIRKSNTYTCKICDKRIKNSVKFQGHMREHAGEPTPYWCDLCDKRFDSLVPLDRHRQRHSLNGRWECSKCGKVYTQRDNYFTHLKLHENPNRNKCEVCGRKYASPANLRKHMVVHLEEKPLECPVCEKRFNFRSPFKYHMRKHTLETATCTCEICGLKCYSNNSLAIHMNIHSGTKPFVCKYCGKRFAQWGTKTGHEMTHSSMNKRSLDEESEEQRTKNMLESFNCDQCLISFTSLERLNCHMKTHNTLPQKIPDSNYIKPHSCEICDMSFLSISGLRKHRIKKHPEHVAFRKKSTTEQKIDEVRLDKAKDPKTSKQKSDSKKYLPTSKRRSDSKKDQITSKQSLDRTKNLLLSKQRCYSNKDLPTSLANHLTTSKQRLDPSRNSLMPKQRSGQKLDISKSKQRSTDTTKHNSGKKECIVCGKFVADFTRHMKFHGEREYVCRVCGFKFHMACNLKRHMRVHTGEMPFRCNITGERFRKAEALKTHTARHEGREIKKFECPTCGKKFIDNYHLRRHSVVHKWQRVCDTDLQSEGT